METNPDNINTESTKKVVYSLSMDPLAGFGIDTSKKIKKIAETEEWNIFYSNGDVDYHDNDTDEPPSMDELLILDSSMYPSRHVFLRKLISIKQQGYKSQDKQKNLFEENKFISLENIFELLKSTCLLCFYCNLRVKLVYKYARDPKQWSLERINNSYGHNTDNVVIACLDCNLRRRTMYQDRYKKTKEMYHVVKLDA